MNRRFARFGSLSLCASAAGFASAGWMLFSRIDAGLPAPGSRGSRHAGGVRLPGRRWDAILHSLVMVAAFAGLVFTLIVGGILQPSLSY